MPARPRRQPRRKDTPPPATGPSEKEVLVGLLDYLRDSAAAKLDGVPEPEVRTPAVQSGTNLLGLVRHLTYVERFRFLNENVSNWAATLRPRKQDTVESVLDGYREAIAQANEVIAGYDDLGAPAPVLAGRTARPNMRWTISVVINETARHAGHLDIIRERIDGRTGR